MTALSDLRSRVLAGSGEDRELERDLYWCLQRQWAERAFWNAAMGMPRPLGDKLPEGLGRLGVEVSAPRFLTDLNAVLALVEEKLPGWPWTLASPDPLGYAKDSYACLADKETNGAEEPWNVDRARFEARAPSPARALLAALLEAMETNDGE